jgi:DNA-binding response OmpR family regulator
MCTTKELAVLVVDSDEDSLKEMCDILKGFGLNRMICASNAEEALEWLNPEQKDHIDIIVTNNELSGMNGFTFIHQARELCPDKQILMYSNCKKPTAYLLALNIGATDYVDKDHNFKKNINKRLPFWLGIATAQVQIKENHCVR